jgi:CheY-like chemotaxis protein
LVTDWMLREQIHGLHVSGVLTSIDPRLQTVLITGFDSSELRWDAERGRVLRLLGKPFELDEVRHVLESARAGEEVIAFPVPFGVVRVNADCSITHINDKAWEMFAHTSPGRSAARMDEVFSSEVIDCIRNTPGHWYPAHPRSTESLLWWVNCRPVGDERLCILVPEEDAVLKHDSRVRLLVGDPAPDPGDWPFRDQVLILEPDPGIARLHALQLESLGCTAYRADQAELALRMIEANPQIGILVFDRPSSEAEAREIVERVRRIRPNLKVVGNDRSGDPSVYRSIDVGRFLAKPWRVTDLIRVLESPPDGHGG